MNDTSFLQAGEKTEQNQEELWKKRNSKGILRRKDETDIRLDNVNTFVVDKGTEGEAEKIWSHHKKKEIWLKIEDGNASFKYRGGWVTD